MASTNMEQPLTAVAGGATAFDLTPGAPTAHWQGGTTEPMLVRIRGIWSALPLTAANVANGGVREQRKVGCIIAWRTQGQPTLSPFSSVDLASEDILFNDVIISDTRDFVVPAAATPANPFFVNVAGPGYPQRVVDVKARRRVRSEDDRLIISFQGHETWTQSAPPGGTQNASITAVCMWSLRFLYRAHR